MSPMTSRIETCGRPDTTCGDALPPGQDTDADRDEVALRLASRMIDVGKPVLGLCRGLREINVLFGGILSGDVGKGGRYRAAGCDAKDLFQPITRAT